MARVPNANPRTIRVQEEAKRQTKAFFRANPERRHWVRPTMPHELDDLGRDRHLMSPVTIIIRPDPDSLDHVPLAIGGKLEAFPDDERFLAMLWGHIRIQMSTHKAGAPDITISPSIHAEMLRATGHEVQS